MDPVALLAEIESAESGYRPTESDAAEDGVEPHVGEIEAQQSKERRAQNKQYCKASQNPKRNTRVRKPASATARQREWPRGAGEEKEQGKDEI